MRKWSQIGRGIDEQTYLFVKGCFCETYTITIVKPYLLRFWCYKLLNKSSRNRCKIEARKMKWKRNQNDALIDPKSMNNRCKKSIKKSMRNLRSHNPSKIFFLSRLAPILEPNGFRNGDQNCYKNIIWSCSCSRSLKEPNFCSIWSRLEQKRPNTDANMKQKRL